MKFISRQGEAISEAEWRVLREDPSYHVLAESRIGDIFVSTVWWGLDFGLGFFDTWVCGGELNDTHYAHSTESEALAGHAQAISLVAGGSVRALPQPVRRHDDSARDEDGAGNEEPISQQA